MKISISAVAASAVFLLVSAACIIGMSPSGPAYTDGTYNLTVQGRNAPIELEAVVSGGKFASVKVLKEEESFFAQPAEEQIIAAFLKGTPVDKIDAVSGATITSTAMKDALKQFVSKASPAQ